jgi:uncharacterized YccA/Bax inhibitor family protein
MKRHSGPGFGPWGLFDSLAGVVHTHLITFRRLSMALLKTSNPALSGDASRVGGAVLGDSMTISGTVNKAGILLICVVATAAWSWNLFTRSPETALPLLAVGGIGGFIVALVTIFKKTWSPDWRSTAELDCPGTGAFGRGADE